MDEPSYEVRDRVGYLTFDRREALNAFSEDVLSALASTFSLIAQDDGVHAVVVGGGGDVFSVGLDRDLLLRAFEDLSYFRDVLDRFKRILLSIEALPVPVVAAVNGMARAGGFELAIACDLIFVAEEARIGDTHLAYGISPGGGASRRLARLVGPQRAREIIFSGRWLSGREAAEIGLALRCVPRAALPFAVEETVAVYRGRSRAALSATKRAMAAPDEQGLDEEIDALIALLEENPATREALRASLVRS